MHCVYSDDVAGYVKLLPEIQNSGISTEKEDFSSFMSSNMIYCNILHCALLKNAMALASHLIQEGPRELFLTQLEANNSARKRKEAKTCLHIIAEIDNLSLAKKILQRLKDKEKNSMMGRKTNMQVDDRWTREVTWFHVACFHGHKAIVDFCLNNGTKVNDTDSYGETGLFWACKEDHDEVVSMLLKAGADVNLVNISGTPPVYMAVRFGSSRSIKAMMKYKPNLGVKRGLGFETPLILASALGYAEIAEILIAFKADPMEKTSRGETAMHAAASEGWISVMDVLCANNSSSQDMLNCQTKTKETPLHYAVKNKQEQAAQYLIHKGADISVRNQQGADIWQLAVASHSCSMLSTLLQAVGQQNWDNKVSPLHLVAETPDSSEELRIIKDSGMDMSTRDPEGNTYLHIAAKHCNMSVLQDGVGIISADIQNCSGNTALHEAAKAGHLPAVELLLKVCRLAKVNNNGDTALHSAVKSPAASADVVNVIVTRMLRTRSFQVVNEKNASGNTALHQAAKYNRPEVIKHLTMISPSKLNKDGDNPLHIAAHLGNIEVLIEILKYFEYEMDINQRTADGETLLHLLAKGGYVETIQVVIDYGIDLAIQDETGNTFLHDLAEQAGSDPDNFEKYNSVFDEVVKGALKWWCRFKNITIIDEDSEESLRRRKWAVLYLRSEIINNDSLTALQLAVKHGATALVEHMIKVPLLFVNKVGKDYQFDLTDLVPDTLVHKHDSKALMPAIRSFQRYKTKVEEESGIPLTSELATREPAKGEPATDIPEVCQVQLKTVRASLLEIIVSKRPLSVANVLLDIEPVKMVADNYWTQYQVIASFMLLLHIIYMSLLSAFAIPAIQTSSVPQNLTSVNATSTTKDQSNEWFALFLVWPIALFIQEAYFIVIRCYRLIKRLDISEPAFDEMRSDPKQVLSVPDAIVALLVYYMPHVVRITFSVLVFVWWDLHMKASGKQGILLCYIMLIGWLNTISLTRTFRPMHSFTIMLRNIFIKDVLRFLFLYVFILLAFGFGFYCLVRLSPQVYTEFGGPEEIFYQTFGMLLGAGDMMVENVEDKYKAAGYSPVHFKVIYLIYALVTVVVLLNILIAMMNDSYGDIRSKEGQSFRVTSIQSAIEFEKAVPLLPRIFRAIRTKKQHMCYNMEDSRWYMTVSTSDSQSSQDMSEQERMLHVLSIKVDRIATQQQAMLSTIGSLASRVLYLEKGITSAEEQPTIVRGNTAAPVFRPDVYDFRR